MSQFAIGKLECALAIVITGALDRLRLGGEEIQSSTVCVIGKIREGRVMADFRIRVVFPNGVGIYSWKDFHSTFGEIESIAYKLDRQIVFDFCRRYSVPSLYRDAALERLRQFRNRRLLVNDIRHGSYEFVLLIGAAAGVVLWKTIGQTLGRDVIEGYRTSQFSADFKEFSRTLVEWQTARWSDRLRSSTAFLRAKIERGEREVVLRVPGPDEDGKRLPTTAELLEKIERDEG